MTKQKTSKPQTKKMNTSALSWFKNVGKSLGYTSMDMIGTMIPTTMDLVTTNAEAVQDIYNTMTDFRAQSSKIGSYVNSNKQIAIGRKALQNAIQDIKSGKIYNKERQESLYETDEDFNFGDEDFSFSDDLGDDNFTPDEVKDIKEIKKEDPSSAELPIINRNTVNRSLRVNNIENANPQLVKAINSQTRVIAESSNAANETNLQMFNTNVFMKEKFSSAVFSGLNIINDNLSLLVNFQSDSMSKYIGASIKYYEDSITVLHDTLDAIKTKGTGDDKENTQDGSKDPKKKKVTNEDLFGNSFNIKEYQNLVKQNFKKTMSSNAFLAPLKMMWDDDDTLEFMAASPLSFVSSKIINSVIPEMLRVSMMSFDKTLKGFFPALLMKIGGLKTSNNPLLGILGEIFGFSSKKKTSADLSLYKKEAVPFDGVTKKAITEVIPTYLRKILAVMTGKEEMAFDYNSGQFNSVFDMAKQFNKAKEDAALDPFTDVITELSERLDAFEFDDKQAKSTFRDEMNKFFLNLSNKDELVNIERKKDKDGNSVDDLRNVYSFSNESFQNLFRGLMESLPKSMIMETFGKSIYDSRDNVTQLFENIEKDPNLYNYATHKNGIGFDHHIKRDRDTGKVSINKNYGSVLQKTDVYGNTDLDYLRKITTMLAKGIVVYNNDSAGSGTFTNPHQATLDTFQRQQTNHTNEVLRNQRGRYRNNPSHTEEQRLNNTGATFVPVSDLSEMNSRDIASRVNTYVDVQNESEKDNQKIDIFDYVNKIIKSDGGGINKITDMVKNILATPAKLVQDVFKKVDNALYSVIFGNSEQDGNVSFFSKSLIMIKDKMNSFANWMKDSFFTPIKEALFGKDGFFTKLKNSAFMNNTKTKFKDFATKLFGKDEDGTPGLFSDIGDSFRDTMNSIKYQFSGKAYTDSQGNEIPDNPDSIFGHIKSSFSSIKDSTKVYLFGKTNAEGVKTDKGVLGNISSAVGDSLRDFNELIFGKSNAGNKSGGETLTNLTDSLKKSFPKAAAWGLMGGAVGIGMMGSNLGLLGSLFLPGGPLGYAVLGMAGGFLSQSDKFKNWLFGDFDADGNRIGGVLSKATQAFLGKNKNALIGGATIGAARQALGFGLLPSFFFPGGIVGGAITGIAATMIYRSNAVQKFLFGDVDNLTGERIGGIFNKIYQGTSQYKNYIGNGIVGAGTGAGLSLVVGKLGLLGAMLTPGGIMGGAIMGAAAGIALTSKKWQKYIFGEWNEEDGIKQGGLVTKFSNWFKMEVQEPLKMKFSEINLNFQEWFTKSIANPFTEAIDPIKTEFKYMMDQMKNMFYNSWEGFKMFLGTTFEKFVGKPFGEFMSDYVMKPLKKFFGGIFGFASKITKAVVSAPFSLLQSYSTSLVEKQEKRGLKAERKIAMESLKTGVDEDGNKKSRFKTAADIAGLYFSGKRKDEARHGEHGASYYDQWKVDNEERRRKQDEEFAKQRAILNGDKHALKLRREQAARADYDNYSTQRDKDGRIVTDENGNTVYGKRIDRIYDINNDRFRPKKEEPKPSATPLIGASNEEEKPKKKKPTRAEKKAAKEQAKKDAKTNKSLFNPKDVTEAVVAHGKRNYEKINDIGEVTVNIDNDVKTVNDTLTENLPSISASLDRNGVTYQKAVDVTNSILNDIKTILSGGKIQDVINPITSNVAPKLDTQENDTVQPTESNFNDIMKIGEKIADGILERLKTLAGNKVKEKTSSNVVNMNDFIAGNEAENEAAITSDEETSKPKFKPVINNNVKKATKRRVDVVNESTVPLINTNVKANEEKPSIQPNISTNENEHSNFKTGTLTPTKEITSSVDKKSGAESSRALSGNLTLLQHVIGIHHAVEGQLDGVGSNVYKIRKMLNQHFDISDDSIQGSANRDRGGILGRLGSVITRPFLAIKGMLMGPFEKLKGIVDGVKEKIKGAVDAVLAVPRAIMGTIKNIFKGVGDMFKGIGNVLKEGAISLVKIPGKIFDTIGHIAEAGVAVFTDAILPAIGNLTEGLTGLVGGALKGVGSVLHGFGKGIGKTLETVGEVTVKTLGKLGEFGLSVLTGIGKTISGTVGFVADLFLTSAKGAVKLATSTISSIADFTADTLKFAVSTVKDTAKALFSFMLSPVKFIANKLGGLISGDSTKEVFVVGGRLDTVDKVKLVEVIKYIDPTGTVNIQNVSPINKSHIDNDNTPPPHDKSSEEKSGWRNLLSEKIDGLKLSIDSIGEKLTSLANFGQNPIKVQIAGSDVPLDVRMSKTESVANNSGSNMPHMTNPASHIPGVSKISNVVSDAVSGKNEKVNNAVNNAKSKAVSALGNIGGKIKGALKPSGDRVSVTSESTIPMPKIASKGNTGVNVIGKATGLVAKNNPISKVVSKSNGDKVKETTTMATIIDKMTAKRDKDTKQKEAAAQKKAFVSRRTADFTIANNEAAEAKKREGEWKKTLLSAVLGIEENTRKQQSLFDKIFGLKGLLTLFVLGMLDKLKRILSDLFGGIDGSRTDADGSIISNTGAVHAAEEAVRQIAKKALQAIEKKSPGFVKNIVKKGVKGVNKAAKFISEAADNAWNAGKKGVNYIKGKLFKETVFEEGAPKLLTGAVEEGAEKATKKESNNALQTFFRRLFNDNTLQLPGGDIQAIDLADAMKESGPKALIGGAEKAEAKAATKLLTGAGEKSVKNALGDGAEKAAKGASNIIDVNFEPVDDVLKKADDNIISKFKTLATEAMEKIGKLAEEKIPKASGVIGKFAGKLGDALANSSILARFKKKIVAGLTKIGASALSGSLIDQISFGYGLTSGFCEAERLFKVSSDQVDLYMKIISAVFKGVLSVSWFFLIEIVNEIFVAYFGVDLIQMLAVEFYSLLADQESIKKLEDAQADFKADLDEYNKLNGTNLSLDAWNDKQNRTVWQKYISDPLNKAWTSTKRFFAGGEKIVSEKDEDGILTTTTTNQKSLWGRTKELFTGGEQTTGMKNANGADFTKTIEKNSMWDYLKGKTNKTTIKDNVTGEIRVYASEDTSKPPIEIIPGEGSMVKDPTTGEVRPYKQGDDLNTLLSASSDSEINKFSNKQKPSWFSNEGYQKRQEETGKWIQNKADYIGNGFSYYGQKFADTQFGKSAIESSKYVANGAKYYGNKIAEGASWAGNQIVQGAKDIGTSVSNGFTNAVNSVKNANDEMTANAFGKKNTGNFTAGMRVSAMLGNGLNKLSGGSIDTQAATESIHGLGVSTAEEATKFMESVKKSVTDTGAAISADASKSWNEYKEKASKTWSDVSKWMDDAGANISKGASEKWQWIQEQNSKFWGDVGDSVSKFGGAIAEDASKSWNDFKTRAAEKWNSIMSTISNSPMAKEAAENWDGFSKWASESWSKMGKSISETGESISKNTSDSWTWFQEQNSKFWGDVGDSVSKFGGAIAADASTSWSGFVTKAQDSWGSIAKTIADSDIGKWFSREWKDITDNLDSIFGDMGEKIKNALSFFRRKSKETTSNYEDEGGNGGFGEGDVPVKVTVKTRPIKEEPYQGEGGFGVDQSFGKRNVDARTQYQGSGGGFTDNVKPVTKHDVSKCPGGDCDMTGECGMGNRNIDARTQYQGEGGFGNEMPESINNFAYYSQGDPRWANYKYMYSNGYAGSPRDPSLKARGCGPTSLAMVLTNLTGKKYSPVQMAEYSRDNGFSTNVGTGWGLFRKAGSEWDTSVSETGRSSANIIGQLKAGKPVILSGTRSSGIDPSSSPFTSAGHFVVAVGTNGGDKLLINDPRSPGQSKAYSTSTVMNEMREGWAFSYNNSGKQLPVPSLNGTYNNNGSNTTNSGSDSSGGNSEPEKKFTVIEGFNKLSENFQLLSDNIRFGENKTLGFEEFDGKPRSSTSGGDTSDGAYASDGRTFDVSGIPIGTNDLPGIYAQYNSLFNSAGAKYGVEPAILKAMSMQESGGNERAGYPNAPAWGLMQIENTVGSEFANFGRQYEGVNYSLQDRMNPARAIPFAAYRFSNDLKHYSGDYLKAIQAYNFSKYSLDILLRKFPSDWMNHRAEMGQYNGVGGRYGDPKYIEHVLRYYHGNIIKNGGGKGEDDGADYNEIGILPLNKKEDITIEPSVLNKAPFNQEPEKLKSLAEMKKEGFTVNTKPTPNPKLEMFNDDVKMTVKTRPIEGGFGADCPDNSHNIVPAFQGQGGFGEGDSPTVDNTPSTTITKNSFVNNVEPPKTETIKELPKFDKEFNSNSSKVRDFIKQAPVDSSGTSSQTNTSLNEAIRLLKEISMNTANTSKNTEIISKKDCNVTVQNTTKETAQQPNVNVIAAGGGQSSPTTMLNMGGNDKQNRNYSIAKQIASGKR